MARKISDLYIVESLRQSTEAHPEPLRWNEQESNGYATQGYLAQVGAVRIELHDVPGTTGSRLCLTLMHQEDKVCVQEPYCIGVFGRKYRCDDERQLARAIRRLHSAVVRQRRLRAAWSAHEAEDIRDRVFRQLLFGAPGLQREA